MLNGSVAFLRTPDISDVQFMLDIENNERYWHLSGVTSPYSKKDIEQFINESSSNLKTDCQLRLVIIDISTKKRAGLLDVFEYEPLHKRAGIGIFLLEEFRGHGLASDALRVLIQYLFKIMKLHQLWCNILTENTESMKLFNGAGFNQTAIKKDWIFHNGKFHDEAIFQLINPNHRV